MFAVAMATWTARQARLITIMLKTNEGKTIGQHVEQFQEDQVVLRDELLAIARNKVKADAILAAASLEAIAKLSAAANIRIQETAESTAEALVAKADQTAHLLTSKDQDEDPVVTAEALVAKADQTANILTRKTNKHS